jgi:hypothetical protein
LNRITRTAVLLSGALFSLTGLAQAHLSRERGEALHAGRAALTGRLAGHSTDLPAHVLACVNCHGKASGTERGNSFARGLAPRLEGGWLREFRSRRNGPPTAYDLPAFCRTLRTGIDPMEIQLPSRMPRFEMPDSDCESLWNYLNTPLAAAR